jgi:hypothetical protein
MKKIISLFFAILCIGGHVFAQAHVGYTQKVKRIVPDVVASAVSTSLRLREDGTFQARVAGTGPAVPTGSVTFTAEQHGKPGIRVVSKPVVLDSAGTAAWKAGFKLPDPYEVAVQYSGDRNYFDNVSAPIPFDVTGSPDFNIILSSNNNSVTQGNTIQTGVTVNSLNGFQGEVKLECSSGSTLVNCSLDKDRLTFEADMQGDVASGGLTATVKTIPTVVKTLPAMFVAGLFMPVMYRGRRKYLSALLLCALCGVASFSGCMAARQYEQTDGTQPGTYSIAVTGRSGNKEHTAILNVVVVRSAGR